MFRLPDSMKGALSKKPLVSVKNCKAQILWAKAHFHWRRKKWGDILCNLLFETDGIKWIQPPKCRRFDRKYQLPTIKHGGGSCLVINYAINIIILQTIM